MTRPILLIGGGGHGKSVLGSLLRAGLSVAGIIDPDGQGKSLLGVPILGGDEIVLGFAPDAIDLVNGIGNVGNPGPRVRVHSFFADRGYRFATLIDPTAIIGAEVVLEPGVQVLAGAVVQTGCHLEQGCVVNSRAVVDHDCRIGAHAHIATGAVLAGSVTVGARALVGCGASVRHRIRIGDDAVIGTGAAVVADVAASNMVVGVPARPLQRGV
ncbi:MAG: NeuD/PglB/VioB family sugar acetyltransferase [Alphaproteobacteria bacterium]|nr:NeuD/PglB/VioB family sugar acetyltransferase [Alphaproteobacteria bacterium]